MCCSCAGAAKAVTPQQHLFASRLCDLDEPPKAPTGERFESFFATPTERTIAAIPARGIPVGPRDNRQIGRVMQPLLARWNRRVLNRSSTCRSAWFGGMLVSASVSSLW